MHHFAYRQGVLCCEDVPLDVIAQAVGTPAYVYSTATLERHYDVFAEAFSPRTILIAFAVKANANIAVLSTLARRGAGADTVSAGEIYRALRAGIPPERIIFSGVGKTAEELAFALETGVRQINVESPAELAMLEETAERIGKPAPLAIRVNPDVGAGAHDKITTGGAEAKFGVSPQDAAAMFMAAGARRMLKPLGLAVHIGSQIRDLSPLRESILRLRALAHQLRAAGSPCPRLDLGGGLGVPYYNEPEPPSPQDYAAMVEDAMRGFEVELTFEPGRLIAANAGVLLTRVIREQPRARRRIVIVDAAMNDLIRPAMYEAFHDLVPVRRPEPEAPLESVDIVGPVCETGDTFARARPLPPLKAGDLACFLTAGAYGAVMSSTYNARPLVPEVLVSADRFAVVRARMDVEAQVALERVPEWLAP